MLTVMELYPLINGNGFYVCAKLNSRDNGQEEGKESDSE